MTPQTSTDNDHLFRSSRQPSGSAPRHREEATRSWWCDAETREAFTEAAEREQRRMARSHGAKLVKGVLLGWGVSGRKP